ncbi:MAG TPA: PHP domain-containing protein [Negativicutes bacterium]|nr:PHP domain-containing protein [Negativicutes bacterium]
MKLFADYHTHTKYSHGTGTIRENVEAARAKGLEQVAISDHGPANPVLGVGGPRVLLDIKQEADYYDGRYDDIRVLTGVEANIVGSDGKLDIPRFILKQLDIVLAGLHRFTWFTDPRAGMTMYLENPLGKLRMGALSRRLAAKARLHNTKAVVEAVYRYDIDIITHPGLHMSIDTYELARACAKRGTALEINASHGTSLTEFARAAASQGVSFAINSDAHHPRDVGRLEPGLAVAESLGLTADRIINARET